MGHPLLDAIYSKFTNTSAVTTAIPGGLSREHYEPPDGTPVLPYAMYSVISITHDYVFPARKPYDADIQFDVIGDDDDECYAGIAAIYAAYEDATLVLTSGSNTDSRPLGQPVPLAFDVDGAVTKDDEAEHPFRWTVTFRFHVEP